MKGFTRSSTSSQISKQNQISPTNLPNHPLRTDKVTTENTEEKVPGRKIQYCHYFTNTGRCLYEETSRLKCKFEHKTAPMCRLNLACNRQKCMYSHSRVNRTGNFLPDSRTAAPMGNPWQTQTNQTMNPWMSTPSHFQPHNWQMAMNGIRN